MNRFACFPVILILLSGAGCASKSTLGTIGPDHGVELAATPFFPQKKYQCGPASLAMLLGSSGVAVHPDDLTSLTYLPGRQGSLQVEMISACRKFGRIPYLINPDLNELVSEIQSGRPVLVLQNYGLQRLPAYHYAVVIGVLPDDIIVLRSGEKKRMEMKASLFELTWKRAGSWGLIALLPGDLPSRPDAGRYLDAVTAFESTDNGPQAATAYRSALDIWPGNQLALFALGNNFLRRGIPIEAMALYQELLAVNPDHVAAANNLAEALTMQGHHAEALAVIQHAVTTARRSKSPLLDLVKETMREIKSNTDRP